MDANGDGRVSMDEAPGQMQGFFGQMDADSDGFISESEFQNGPGSAPCASLAFAQGTPPQARFEAAPKLGEMVPNLTLFDDQGNPANLRDITRGHYTVMTLGSLT